LTFASRQAYRDTSLRALPSGPTIAWKDSLGIAPAFARAHAHGTLIWATKVSGHTFDYDAVNGADPAAHVGSVWRVSSPSRREKRHGLHPTHEPPRLVRRPSDLFRRAGDADA
jgi:hypothetical protein